MNISLLENMVRSSNIEDIERALVRCFAKANHLDIDISPFLSNFINDAEISLSLMASVEELGSYTLEELSVALEVLIPEKDRIVNGAFFTPAYIVDYIIESVAPKPNESIADISCGCGAFLLGVIRYYQRVHHRTVSQIISENLFGYDILPYNVRRAKLLISLYALLNNEVISEEILNIHCLDSLAHKWSRKFDCIVGNPPYVKFQDLNDDTRAFLLANFKTTSFGTFNLYFAFFELGHNLLSDNGRLGYITPNNYFTSLAGESLRKHFQQLQCVYKIVDFNATKVFEVQTYTALTFLNKQTNGSIQYGRIKEHEAPKDFLNVIFFSPNNYLSLNSKKWRLLCGEEHHNISQIENIGDSIGDLFNICVGIATLKDDVYSLIPIAEDEKYYHFTKHGRTWKVERELTRATVKISDLKCQDDLTHNTRRFIFPYVAEKGKMVPIDETVMASSYPLCYEYLLSVKDVLAGRGKGKHIYTPFYAYGRTQGLNRFGVKLYTPTFSKHPRFIYDLDCDSLFTNGYGIYFRETSSSLFDTNPIASPENLDVIQKILNSSIMDYYVKTTSVAIEGGYPCYQKNFIERFTIPSLTSEQIEALRNCNDSAEIDKFLAEIYNVNLPAPNLVS